MAPRVFSKSEALLRRAEKTIPLGSQTFSKSRTQYPQGASPYFLERGAGSRVWDVDGNEYIDFVNSLAAVTLGYRDPDVDAAVREQLDDGVILSLPHRREAEVAELICDLVPCAEMVRFGKNGSDATAGAIRLARAYTRRDRVAVCGYHGWQDWFIGSTLRNRGVPDAVSSLTTTFLYNDIASLDAALSSHPGEFAAVILEPMNIDWPANDFLQKVQERTRLAGAVLIFDETITGFRFHNGGAQALFGVIPDLACFGKGIANGYPLSAVTGRAELMMLMEEIFFSFTFGGELLSLAAAKAVLIKLVKEPVLETIKLRGDRLIEGMKNIFQQHSLLDVFGIKGHPSWTFLTIAATGRIDPHATKTLLMQELHQRGYLSIGTHNLSLAHTEKDIDSLLDTYGELLPIVANAARSNTTSKLLRCDPLVPLFRVR